MPIANDLCIFSDALAPFFIIIIIIIITSKIGPS
jgi:hypothetical protein